MTRSIIIRSYRDLDVWKNGVELALYIRFLYIANGSLMELETELHITERLGLLNGDDARNLERDTQRLGRMLSKLIVRLKERHSRRP